MEYEICEAESTEALKMKVLAMVADGWQPMGGVAFDHATVFTTRAHQAMIRAAPQKPMSPVMIIECRSWWCRLLRRRTRTACATYELLRIR